MDEPADDVIGAVCGVLGLPVPRPGARDPLGSAVDEASPGPATQAADSTLRALLLTAWAGARGGPSAFARLPEGEVVLATWAALDVLLPLGPVDVARTASPHLPDQARRLAALCGLEPLPGWPAMLPVLQVAVGRVAPHHDELRAAILGALWGPDGRLRHRPDRLVFYGRLGGLLSTG